MFTYPFFRSINNTAISPAGSKSIEGDMPRLWSFESFANGLHSKLQDTFVCLHFVFSRVSMTKSIVVIINLSFKEQRIGEKFRTLWQKFKIRNQPIKD